MEYVCVELGAIERSRSLNNAARRRIYPVPNYSGCAAKYGRKFPPSYFWQISLSREQATFDVLAKYVLESAKRRNENDEQRWERSLNYRFYRDLPVILFAHS